ncbi:MAG TPA: FAD-dependent oxidoreductase [Jatrophihabitans sp.]|nr:FAD-dependent oxidoreductase [Jatrophihabitans sp.]
MRVCVIGAGAAGMESTRVLRQAGHDVVCFEAGHQIGGHWNTDYEFLHLITPRDASGFPSRPMPADYPLFPSRDQVRDYLQDFAGTSGIAAAIRFGTRVIRLTPLADGADGWAVHTRSETAADEVDVFDAVVIANGHHHEPRRPAVAAAFQGRSLHSAEYTNIADLAGPRVLVVGSGNSGCDLAVDTAVHGVATEIVVRHGHVFQPKTYFGRPRNALPVLRSLPRRLAERVSRELVRISVGTYREYPGLPEPVTSNLDKQLPVVNEQLLYWIHHGRIAVRPGIDRIDGTTVHFADGTSGSYDTILWATGFRVTLPFLDPALLTCDGEVPVRVGAATVPLGTRRLYTVGLTSPRGAQFPVFAIQAELVARLLALDGRLPERLDETLAAVHRPDHSIDILRPVWLKQVAATRRWLDRTERRARSTVPEPVPATPRPLGLPPAAVQS